MSRKVSTIFIPPTWFTEISKQYVIIIDQVLLPYLHPASQASSLTRTGMQGSQISVSPQSLKTQILCEALQPSMGATRGGSHRRSWTVKGHTAKKQTFFRL